MSISVPQRKPKIERKQNQTKNRMEQLANASFSATQKSPIRIRIAFTITFSLSIDLTFSPASFISSPLSLPVLCLSVATCPHTPGEAFTWARSAISYPFSLSALLLRTFSSLSSDIAFLLILLYFPFILVFFFIGFLLLFFLFLFLRTFLLSLAILLRQKIYAALLILT